MKDTDLKAIFKKVVVDEITKKQEGLTRFINQMRYQITKAEEKWANLYYDFLRGIFSAMGRTGVRTFFQQEIVGSGPA